MGRRFKKETINLGLSEQTLKNRRKLREPLVLGEGIQRDGETDIRTDKGT